MRLKPPGRSFWITPGGGRNQGEAEAEALRRELWEETGRTDLNVGPLVWTRTIVFETEAGALEQHECYYLIRTDRFEPAPLGIDGIERDWFAGYRWWPVRSIQYSHERFSPRRLGAFLQDLLQNGIPEQPVDVGR